MNIFDKNDMNSFYNIAIRPLLEPFADLMYHTTYKLVFAFAAFIFMIIAKLIELISTPIEFWMGLMLFVFVDFVAGMARVFFDDHIEFDVRKFKRTAYKIVAYPIVLVISGIYSNTFPEMFSTFQYFIVAILMGGELFSIFRNLKILPVLLIALEMMKSKVDIDLRKFSERVDAKDRELIKKQDERTTYKKNPE